MTTQECWMRGSCPKYKVNKECDNVNFCIRLYKLHNLYENSLLSNSQRQPITILGDPVDMEQYNKLKTLFTDIVNFVKSGKSLYIHSTNCGNGKTTWAVKAIQEYFNKIWIDTDLGCKALYINVPRFLLALKDSITNPSEYIDFIKANVLKADLVVWDEVGTKSVSTFEHEHLLNMINTRIECEKANIYTSNLSGEELRKVVGERLYSRVVNLSTDIEFKGRDKRSLIK